MLISPHLSICKIWRLLLSPPKMNSSFLNATPQERSTSRPLKSNVVDNSPSVSISLGVLLSIEFSTVPLKFKFKVKSNNLLGFFENKNNIAKLIGIVVVNSVVALLVANKDVVLLTWIVAAVVVVLVSMTFGLLFTVAIVTIPAVHIATSITSQIINL